MAERKQKTKKKLTISDLPQDLDIREEEMKTVTGGALTVQGTTAIWGTNGTHLTSISSSSVRSSSLTISKTGMLSEEEEEAAQTLKGPILP